MRLCFACVYTDWLHVPVLCDQRLNKGIFDSKSKRGDLWYQIKRGAFFVSSFFCWWQPSDNGFDLMRVFRGLFFWLNFTKSHLVPFEFWVVRFGEVGSWKSNSIRLLFIFIDLMWLCTGTGTLVHCPIWDNSPFCCTSTFNLGPFLFGSAYACKFLDVRICMHFQHWQKWHCLFSLFYFRWIVARLSIYILLIFRLFSSRFYI